MATQEELANLLARNLSLTQPTYVAPEEPVQVDAPQPVIYSISQHYHHSSHPVNSQPPPPSRPASEPPQTDQLTTESILSRHGVDVGSLFPSQISLFKTADANQQMRLIELWRIAPPTYGGHALSQDLWPATSIQQEEYMAKQRYEKKMLEERMLRAGAEQTSIDTEDNMSEESATPMPLTPIQGGDSRWPDTQVAEPYMASVYEAMARREYEASAASSQDMYTHFGSSVNRHSYNHATDPVYRVGKSQGFKNTGGDWQDVMHQRQEEMENQYGAFEQQHYQNEGVVGGYNEEDVDMM